MLGIFLLIQVSEGCLGIRMNQSEIKDYFADKPQEPSLLQYNRGKHTINYAALGNQKQPAVIFLHGAPGSWTAFISYFSDSTLLKEAYLMAVDRPGNGRSGFGNPVISLEDQARLLKPLLEKSSKPVVLVGHSLGGPVAARLAMDYPELVNGLVLVAPSIDPGLEPNEDWWRMPLNSPFLSWLVPTSLYVANAEIYHLKDELEKMIPLWKNIQAPVTIIQGKEDSLVPPGNAEFARKMLVNAAAVEIVMLKSATHFIPWNRPESIKKAILKHLAELN